MVQSADARARELGYELRAPAPLSGAIVRAKVAGSYLYLSGQGPAPLPNGSRLAGKVGADVTAAEAYEAARTIGHGLLGSMKEYCGSLDRVRSVIKVLGFVSCAPGFNEVSQVINGCSELFLDVFGEEVGRHARSAVGVAELPNSYPVEIEAIVEIDMSDT